LNASCACGFCPEARLFEEQPTHLTLLSHSYFSEKGVGAREWSVSVTFFFVWATNQQEASLETQLGAVPFSIGASAVSCQPPRAEHRHRLSSPEAAQLYIQTPVIQDFLLSSSKRKEKLPDCFQIRRDYPLNLSI
jgi:hypothetical protein